MKLSETQENDELRKLLYRLVSTADLIEDILTVEEAINGIQETGFIKMGWTGPRRPINREINFKNVFLRWEGEGRIRFLSKDGPFQKWQFSFDRTLCGLEGSSTSSAGVPLAAIDSLTTLLARSVFDNHIATFHKEALSQNLPLSLLMIDIDHFKEVNDTYGHPAGDTVLRRVAHLIKDSTHHKAFAYRYGGEEICILARNASLTEASVLAERLREDIETMLIPQDSTQIRVTASIGLACTAQVSGGPDELLAAADSALYDAKESGRNKVSVPSGVKR